MRRGCQEEEEAVQARALPLISPDLRVSHGSMDSHLQPPRLTASEVLAAVATHRLGTIEGMLEGTVQGSDPECLHKMRTSTRRLRSALRMCRGVIPKAQRRTLNAELAWLARLLGDVRDPDVVSVALPALLDRSGVLDAPSEQTMARWFERRWAAARTPLLPALESPRFQHLMADLRDLSVGDHRGRRAGHDAADLLASRLCQALEVVWTWASAASPSSPDDHLHELRIHNKRLRYGCELAKPVLAVTPYLPVLEIPHDILGDHQDVVVASEWIDQLAADEPSISPDVLHVWRGALDLERRRLRAAFSGVAPTPLSETQLRGR